MEYYIVFEGVINPENVLSLSSQLRSAIDDPSISEINIFFSSLGGSTYHGFSLATIIQNSPKPIKVHATNHIDSIANVIFLSASKESRTSESHAKFFVHGASMGAQNFDERSLIESLSAVKAENHRIATFISENSDLTMDQVRSRMKNGETMSATDALKIGYIDQVIHKTVPAGARRYDIIALP